MYSEALEKQMELITAWRGEIGKEWSSYLAPGIVSIVGEPLGRPSKGDIQKIMTHELENAETFFVARKICELIESVYSTVPDVPLTFDMMPTMNGWIYLEKSFPILPKSGVEKSPFGDPPKLKAFSWGVQSIFRIEQSEEGVGFTLYEDGGTLPLPLEIINWSYGINWGKDWEDAPYFDITNIPREVSLQRAINARKYIIAMFSFIQQRLLTISHLRADRASRRRYERQYFKEVPTIHVILLRAKSYINKGNITREVEWSCRWIVRGHWRQQWYPSKNTNKAIWIYPYIKGPDNKPLKKPSVNLFVVVR